MLDVGSRHELLTRLVSEQLAESCPELSHEARVAFAAQIAAAALRARRGGRITGRLYEMGGQSN
jgi:hypothetical protein